MDLLNLTVRCTHVKDFYPIEVIVCTHTSGVEYRVVYNKKSLHTK